MRECACCFNKLKPQSKRYCSEKCAMIYKEGVVLLGMGRIKRAFQSTSYTLSKALKEAEEQGYEYVTVRFFD